MNGRGHPLRVLVAERKEQLARALIPAFATGWRVEALGRAEGLDLAGPAEAIAVAVRAEVPDLVVDAAAYTAVDCAESEPAAAITVNRESAAALASRAGGGRPSTLDRPPHLLGGLGNMADLLHSRQPAGCGRVLRAIENRKRLMASPEKSPGARALSARPSCAASLRSSGYGAYLEGLPPAW